MKYVYLILFVWVGSNCFAQKARIIEDKFSFGPLPPITIISPPDPNAYLDTAGLTCVICGERYAMNDMLFINPCFICNVCIKDLKEMILERRKIKGNYGKK